MGAPFRYGVELETVGELHVGGVLRIAGAAVKRLDPVLKREGSIPEIPPGVSALCRLSDRVNGMVMLIGGSGLRGGRARGSLRSSGIIEELDVLARSGGRRGVQVVVVPKGTRRRSEACHFRSGSMRRHGVGQEGTMGEGKEERPGEGREEGRSDDDRVNWKSEHDGRRGGDQSRYVDTWLSFAVCDGETNDIM